MSRKRIAGSKGSTNSGEVALLRAANVQPGDRVLDLGWAGRPVGLSLDAAEVCFVSSDVRRIRDCEQIIEQKELHGARAALEASPGDVSGGPFDVVLYRPERWVAKGRVFELIDAVFQKMAMGGRFCLAGRRDAGVESYAKRLQAVFGRVGKVLAKSGLRIYEARKEAEVSAVDPVETSCVFEVSDLRAGPYTFEANAGVFSRDGLDPGTRVLIEKAGILPGDRVLDLGCGYGALGIVAAREAHAGDVLLLDVDMLAIRCAEKNLVRNGIENARTVLSDGFEAIEGNTFDLVLCNAPTHTGADIAQLFTEGVLRHLKPGGRWLVVAMRPGLYRKRMAAGFACVETLGIQDGYTVLCATV